MISSSTKEQIEQSVHLDFLTSNNETEYETMIVGLDLALILATSKVEVRSDSQLVVGQIQREYEAKDECMTHYLTGVEACLARLANW